MQAEDKGEEPAAPSDREDAPKEKGKPGRRGSPLPGSAPS
jgi:hypothetical protein